MSRMKYLVLFILLVLILLVASVLFGVLTYGLDAQGASHPGPSWESAGRSPWLAQAGTGRLDHTGGAWRS